MKRAIAAILAAFFLAAAFPIRPIAAETKEGYIQFFSDGSRIETYIILDTQYFASSIRSGAVTQNYYGITNNLEWSAKLTGTFTYDGETAVCTASRCNITVYNSDWVVAKKTEGKSGATATAEIKMEHRLLGITVSTVERTLQLTCDPDGTLH